jgi:hypothetical protein
VMSSGPDLGRVRMRVEEHLEGIKDGSLMVLKGHLLMEEVLYDLVRAKCEQPRYLEEDGARETGWLGREDSNLRMAESKSVGSCEPNGD